MVSENQQIANDADTAIGNFAKDTDGQLMLGDLKAFGPIVALIGATKEATKCSLSCCWTLSKFVIPDKNENDKCHQGLAKRTALKALVHMCKSRVDNCRQRAMMTLSNVAANDLTQMQSQVVFHGALSNDDVVRQNALLCLVNIAGNSSNHSALLSHDVKALVSCVFVNLVSNEDILGFVGGHGVSNEDILGIVGGHGGINILMSLSSSIHFHSQCAGTAGLRRLAVTSKI
eukprot:scaffold2612_cov267-Chaetoceros_neogracile.AAC.30